MYVNAYEYLYGYKTESTHVKNIQKIKISISLLQQYD